MITLFVTLYSLLCLCTAEKTSDIKELHVKTVKRGENVTMECNFNIKNKDKLVWYRQSFGKFPQFLAKSYSDTLGYKFDTQFKDSRFSITVNDHKFDLNINETREDDEGDYFCVELEGSLLKFTSGTRLQFEGKLQCSDSSDGKVVHFHHFRKWIIALTTSIIISLILIAVLIGVLFKNQRKGVSSRNHQIPTNQADDEDALNYAAVSFAKKPSSSRTSRDKSHEDVYAQVKIK
ncbi:uncharacterized protein LOC117599707 [Pangasianodon hypophthalmus]|uniref:uncharacterized protein LOC117599707 n=1 Tax=Pangasianodon hypophthalmus TaxID=310915 RepID=UPI002307E7F0|nr:uncharacterized protein LOC117599707 [Pangasianodon hypophthalmus]